MGSEKKSGRTSKKQRADQAVSDDQPGKLPDHLEKQQQYVTCGDTLNYNVRSGLLIGILITAMTRSPMMIDEC